MEAWVQAEGLDLRASQSRAGEAVIVEAKLDKGQGPVATAIVKRGKLAVGQYVAVGTEWGKLRSLRNAARKSLKQALPGQPVEIAGLKGVPQAGDQLQVLPRSALPVNSSYLTAGLSCHQLGNTPLHLQPFEQACVM